MSSLPPVADPTANLPCSSSSPNDQSIAVVTPPLASAVVSPTELQHNVVTIPDAPVPEATAAAIAAVAAPQDTTGVEDNASIHSGAPSPTPGALSKHSKSSKKKKTHPAVTMATSSTTQSGNQGAQGENTGRWTAEEHRLFLQGLELHGKGWKKIAGLIKSRTVVQIRTHAQKYFQKLAKAKQNGEDGEILMDARGGANAIPSVTTTAAQTNKRRKHTSGTKRKAIQSIVASAQREAKRRGSGSDDGITSVAPALAPYILPVIDPMNDDLAAQESLSSITEPHETISGQALEDCLFRFLTPAPIVPLGQQQPNVNEVARQAGANPITLPVERPNVTPALGEVSPTGVADFSMYSLWTDPKGPPSWFSKGSDVDALLDVADSLDWLTDTGDLNETYEEAANALEAEFPAPTPVVMNGSGSHQTSADQNSASMNSLPRIDSNAEAVVPPLPSLFGVVESGDSVDTKKLGMLHTSHSVTNLDDHLQVFDTPIEEHDFVSAILDDNVEGSSVSLAALAS